jgi:hypothetical protein
VLCNRFKHISRERAPSSVDVHKQKEVKKEFEKDEERISEGDDNMTFSRLKNMAISVEKKSPLGIAKATFPLRYGAYSEIRTSEYEFIFNLNGEIKFIRGLNSNWPHPAEQLKRTDGNDWVYYTVGDVSGEKGIISWMGEYYLPCLPYPSNPVWEVNYFANPGIMNAFAEWSQLYANLYGVQKAGLNSEVKDLIDRIFKNHDGVLHERSQRLHEIIGGRISVLPPDTRHVDYEIIPIVIADGCLYHCDFCCVKSEQAFHKRSEGEVLDQIQQLKTHYGRNLQNLNALFLGNHDALAAGGELIEFAASEAHKTFGFNDARDGTSSLFLFGSVDSLLKSKQDLFEKLNQLPYHTHINIGFESVDPSTLKIIGKPIDETKVRTAFERMLDINQNYANIEITGNFIMGDQLSDEHYRSISELLSGAPAPSKGKGAVYLSPLKNSSKRRELLPRFYHIKEQSNLPVHVYLIQRL